MAKSPLGAINSIKLRPTEDGLHLSNSILWLDAHLRGDLSFLSSAFQPIKTTIPQVIATEETVKLLEAFRRKPNSLICQYNRPFSVGRLNMELLPTGSVLGGASLYVETDGGRLLYAPQLQTDRIPILRQMQLRKADTLVLGATHADPATPLPNRKKEKDRLVEMVRNSIAQGKFPAIYCDPLAIAPEITHLLSKASIPVSTHSLIYRINSIYDAYGSKIGNYGLYNRKRTKQKVLILPISQAPLRLLSDWDSECPIFLIDDKSSTHALGDYKFCLSSTCDGQNLKEVISAVRPREIYVFGTYSKSYEEWLRPNFPGIKSLFLNDQPTLF